MNMCPTKGVLKEQPTINIEMKLKFLISLSCADTDSSRFNVSVRERLRRVYWFLF